MSLVNFPDRAIHDAVDMDELTISRFTVGTTLDGWEVLDQDGRPLVQRFEELDAVLDADTLNTAAMVGPKALARAIARL